MNQAIDQLVNEIYEIVQAAWLGVGLRGMGQRRAREDVFQAGWPGHWPFAHRGCWCWTARGSGELGKPHLIRATCSRDLPRADLGPLG